MIKRGSLEAIDEKHAIENWLRLPWWMASGGRGIGDIPGPENRLGQ
jgi:hypothetical protein